jgi:hypothetical protein
MFIYYKAFYIDSLSCSHNSKNGLLRNTRSFSRARKIIFISMSEVKRRSYTRYAFGITRALNNNWHSE